MGDDHEEVEGKGQMDWKKWLYALRMSEPKGYSTASEIIMIRLKFQVLK